MIILRPAHIIDSKNLLLWKNDPVMRKFSIETNRKISAITHSIWLAKHLKEIQIIMYNGNSVGDIRISGDEVAIKLDKNYRGLGIAKQALKLVLRDGLIAKIVDGNVASLALFTGLGFKPIYHKEKLNKDGLIKRYYILKYNENNS